MMQPQSPLADDLVDRLLRKFGFDARPEADLEGLFEVYSAWCRNVPFDNLRKLIALSDPDCARLPGMDAADFFESWLVDNGGGTCWTTSNALFELVTALGFEARRVAGQMRDLGVTNHGSVIVSIDGAEWLADSSILSNVPLPLLTDLYLGSDPYVPVEIEHGNGEHVIWWDYRLSGDYFPCRILPGEVEYRYYSEMVEASRTESPFNTRLHVKQNRRDGTAFLLGRTRVIAEEGVVTSTELDRESVPESLRRDFGYADSLIARWIEIGGLDALFAPEVDSPPPPISDRKRPTER